MAAEGQALSGMNKPSIHTHQSLNASRCKARAPKHICCIVSREFNGSSAELPDYLLLLSLFDIFAKINSVEFILLIFLKKYSES